MTSQRSGAGGKTRAQISTISTTDEYKEQRGKFGVERVEPQRVHRIADHDRKQTGMR
jgi:hypothetical protein